MLCFGEPYGFNNMKIFTFIYAIYYLFLGEERTNWENITHAD